MLYCVVALIKVDELPAGFEPANEGFADLAIRPLWYGSIFVLSQIISVSCVSSVLEVQ